MIYPALGISLIVHMIIIAAVRANKLLGFNQNKSLSMPRRAINSEAGKNGFLSRVFMSLAIAVVIEFVLFFVLISSFTIVSAGINNNGSNFNVIKNAFDIINSKNIASNNHYIDANIPIGYTVIK